MVRNYKRKTCRGSYPKENLEEAIQAIQSGKISSYAASQTYKIPRSTLMSHIYRGRVKSNTMGRSTALPTDVENNLVTCLRELEKHGFELSKDELINMVARYVKRNDIKTPFKNGIPGKEWLNAFLTRHNFSTQHTTVKSPAANSQTQSNILKAQSDTLNAQSEMLKSQAEVLKSQSESLNRQSEILKTQSQVLKSQSDMLRTESNDPLSVPVKLEEEWEEFDVDEVELDEDMREAGEENVTDVDVKIKG